MTTALDRTCTCTCGLRYCASNRVSLEAPRSLSPDVRRERLRTASKKINDSKQSSSLESASRHYDQWTGLELSIITRTDITVRQMCELTGRTFYAVRTMRKRLRREKALQEVAS